MRRVGDKPLTAKAKTMVEQDLFTEEERRQLGDRGRQGYKDGTLMKAEQDPFARKHRKPHSAGTNQPLLGQGGTAGS